MSRFFRSALLASFLLVGAACTRHVYQPITFDAAAPAAHHTVAVLPFDVAQDRLRLRDIRYADSSPTPEAIRQRTADWTEQQRQECRTLGYELQHDLAAQLQVQQPAGGYSVQFQDVAETNRRLAQAGISYETLLDRSMDELRQALGVDAVLSGQTLLYQPMPNGLNLAARVLLLNNGQATGLPSNTATVNLLLHDCRSGQLLWRFDYQRLGSASLQPERLSKDLVRAVRRSFPYRRTGNG